jgi:hypothetical protein
MSGRRLVSFAGSTVEVIERDAAAAALSKFLFKRFPPPIPHDPCVRLELAGDGPATFALWRDGSPVYRETTAAMAARLLLAEVVHSLSVNCRGDILLHAAAVVRGGRGFLLPGPSGTGKSTLAGWLDHHGFGCLSDEIVGISAADARMLAFPRPICLEADAPAILGGILDLARGEGRVLEAKDALLVVQRSPVPAVPVSLHCIVFPRYVPRTRTALNPLSKTAAAIRLLGSVANAANRPDRGFAEVGRLAGRVPAFELCYGNFAGCAEALVQTVAVDAISSNARGRGVTAESAE